ncbi:MAG: hypothetical protein OEW95_12770, partial [Candidatus Bathyarchaeota archaeon]|nr:hypothetical protein [Candidatus Bathyarchaeota archaeon]
RSFHAIDRQLKHLPYVRHKKSHGGHLNADDGADLDEIIKSRTRAYPKQNHMFAPHLREFGDAVTQTCLDHAATSNIPETSRTAKTRLFKLTLPKLPFQKPQTMFPTSTGAHKSKK